MGNSTEKLHGNSRHTGLTFFKLQGTTLNAKREPFFPGKSGSFGFRLKRGFEGTPGLDWGWALALVSLRLNQKGKRARQGQEHAEVCGVSDGCLVVE